MFLRSFLRRAIALALPLALPACTGSTTDPDLPSDPKLDLEEQAVIQSLNSLRSSQGLPTVTACVSLNVSASAHSDDMRDNGYLDESPPGNPSSTVRTRACTAGYTPACSGTIPMGELVAEGFGTGAETVTQWQNDMTAGPILVNPAFIVAGVGRSIGATAQTWTLDLASVADPSCN